MRNPILETNRCLRVCVGVVLIEVTHDATDADENEQLAVEASVAPTITAVEESDVHEDAHAGVGAGDGQPLPEVVQPAVEVHQPAGEMQQPAAEVQQPAADDLVAGHSYREYLRGQSPWSCVNVAGHVEEVDSENGGEDYRQLVKDRYKAKTNDRYSFCDFVVHQDTGLHFMAGTIFHSPSKGWFTVCTGPFDGVDPTPGEIHIFRMVKLNAVGVRPRPDQFFQTEEDWKELKRVLDGFLVRLRCLPLQFGLAEDSPVGDIVKPMKQGEREERGALDTN